MNFQKVITVIDKSGLFFLKSHNKNGFFLESLDTGQSIFVANAKSKVLALGNIDIVCHEGSMPLLEVFKRMNINQRIIPSVNDDKETLIEFFKKIVPDFDEKQVYPSTIKKVISWYLLLDKHMRSFEDATNEEDEKIGFAD